MFQKIRTLVVCSGAALLLGGVALQASTVRSERFDVPFAFHVQNESRVMPAGVYQIQRSVDSPVVVLTNVKTGARAQILSSENRHEAGKTKLIFSQEERGVSLKNVL